MRLLPASQSGVSIFFTVVYMFSVFGLRKPRYRAVIEAFDWGPSVSRIVLDLGKKTPLGAISPEGTVSPAGFTVWAFQRALFVPRETSANLRFPGSPVEGVTAVDSGSFRTVTRVYPSGPRGEESRDGRFLTLELETGPEVASASILRYDVMTVRNLPVSLEHTITLPGGAVIAPDRAQAPVMPVTEEFNRSGSFRFRDREYGSVCLAYAHFSPVRRYPGKDRYPLVIWLHGAGEGGTEPLVALLGNPVTRLAGERAQSALGGAFVLVPQCPTMWMDDGNGRYSEGGSAKYSRTLMALIRRFVRANPRIDKERIYLGGCSNGGFMTFRLLLDNPGFFAAAFTACEAFLDEWIGEEELKALARVPLRLVHARSDNTVPYTRSSEPLVRRLAGIGARDADAFFPEAILDPSGRYRDKDGNPFMYHCHFSWVYALNDACSFQDGKSLMTWLAEQRVPR